MSEYIWKYLSLDKFISLLENSGLYFPTIKNLKNNIDPEECCIFDYYTNIKKQELKENNNLPIGINKKILEYHNSLNEIKQDAINNILFALLQMMILKIMLYGKYIQQILTEYCKSIKALL